jgi:hypothetical protein
MLSLFYTLHKSLQDILGLLSLLQSYTSRCLVAASNGRCSPSSGFPQYPQSQLQASHSNSWQQLNCSSPLTNSLTRSLNNQLSINSKSSFLLITSRHRPYRKHGSSVVMQALRLCLLAELLPSNGCCRVTYFTVVAEQRVYMPQY